ncbi:hypothetical protein CK203_020966 [Vitis vinifera]|uniref:Uncharacterized protein n=1 Tax=Vitis vinifera TaxID=29760 RepID=A0A438JWM3_VITVI|nr:hypothetical protein CK203_020966 [Vitis vinifera]
MERGHERGDESAGGKKKNQTLEADEHESRTLDDIKEKEPEYFNRVTSVLKRAELDFGL